MTSLFKSKEPKPASPAVKEQVVKPVPQPVDTTVSRGTLAFNRYRKKGSSTSKNKELSSTLGGGSGTSTQ